MFQRPFLQAAAAAHALPPSAHGANAVVSLVLATRTMIEEAISSPRRAKKDGAAQPDCRLKRILTEDDETYLRDQPRWPATPLPCAR